MTVLGDTQMENIPQQLDDKTKDPDYSVHAVAPKVKKLMSQADRVKRLESLLMKAAAYSEFLSKKLPDCVTESVASRDVKLGKRKRSRSSSSEGASKKGKGNDGKESSVNSSSVAEENESNVDVAEKLRNRAAANVAADKSDYVQSDLIAEGFQLRNYQLEGVQWMVRLYENGLHGILADEMGLGKTIQTIGLFAHIRSKGVSGPLLVVAPLSTLSNWAREMKKWAPSLNAILYHGSKPEREQMRINHGLERRSARRAEYPVVITSYEVIMNDRKHLGHLEWVYIVVDEGHVHFKEIEF